MNLRMEARPRDDTLLIVLEGELTLGESTAFKSWVQGQVPETVGEVEVDCRALEYIDSTGLGALIFLRKAVLARGGTLRLIQVSGWLRKFLQVTGLEEAFVGARPEPA